MQTANECERTARVYFFTLTLLFLLDGDVASMEGVQTRSRNDIDETRITTLQRTRANDGDTAAVRKHVVRNAHSTKSHVSVSPEALENDTPSLADGSGV